MCSWKDFSRRQFLNSSLMGIGGFLTMDNVQEKSESLYFEVIQKKTERDNADIQDVIYIKPHHFVDLICSLGAGQVTFHISKKGDANHIFGQKIMSNRYILLEMVLGADDICKPCKYQIGDFCHSTINTSIFPKCPSSVGYWNLVLDLRWCKRLKMKEGDRFSARELCERIRDLAGDITDLYKEYPAERRTKKVINLKKGIKKYSG